MLNYKKFGNSENNLIILHGLFGSLDNWQTLARKYSESCSVYILDARNHGKSFHSDQFDYPAMVEDLKQFLDTNQINKTSILGHSMGGKTAMFFATQYPKYVHKLIVADISPKSYPIKHREIIDNLLGLELKAGVSRADAIEYLNSKFNEKSMVLFFGKNLQWNNEQILEWKFNLKVINENIEKVGLGLSSNAVFSGKTLFVRGKNSDYIKDQDFELIKSHFPNAKIETIMGAGHWLHAEKPDEFFEITSQFLND